MENQELKIRIYHPEEEAFGNSDVRINHCAPAGRSSRRTPSCGPLRAEAPARAAPRCRRALEYLSHRLFCCPSYRSARGRRKMLSEPPRRGAALRTGRLRTACRSSINGMNNLRCAERTTDSASQNSDLQPPPPSAADVGIGERQRDQIIDVVGRPAKRHVGPEDIDEP